MSEQHLTTTQFKDFALNNKITQGLDEAGYIYCTPIQAEGLPIPLAGHDVAREAQTGTGKTAVFLVACFNQLLTHPASESRRKNQPRALMLAPTRELAIQIHKDAELKQKPVPELLDIASEMNLDNVARANWQYKFIKMQNY